MVRPVPENEWEACVPTFPQPGTYPSGEYAPQEAYAAPRSFPRSQEERDEEFREWEKWGEGLLEKGRVQHVLPLALEMERRTDFLYTQVTGLGALQIGGQERCEKAVEGLQGEVRGLAQKVQIVAQAQGGG